MSPILSHFFNVYKHPYIMISESKASDFDFCESFCATRSHNPTQYSHIAGIILPE